MPQYRQHASKVNSTPGQHGMRTTEGEIDLDRQAVILICSCFLQQLRARKICVRPFQTSLQVNCQAQLSRQAEKIRTTDYRLIWVLDCGTSLMVASSGQRHPNSS